MVQKTIVELIDDLDGGAADESITFGLDGVEYTIDLSEGNARKLREVLEPFVGHARRAGGRKQRPTARTAVKAGGDREQNQAIREWARQEGHDVSERGRIPQGLIVRFQEAHTS
ncbi:nucleoid-associated protein Lsr2 [Saccharothrix sp. ALI-22-I]|uniref:histone-like nucleoid-structuring protein Lsr2 n=1 Tax=Saccharothrix sp. ALI-22-I TaxID=1933778 RepID=UPI00097BC8D5|nr:Lsr2 family protein [Saccharothrix sp. ALI-22-I]ONI90063.1 nucleoid-associated protein Lsr2 [Saccharothrix sp. ALI-22-I]